MPPPPPPLPPAASGSGSGSGSNSDLAPLLLLNDTFSLLLAELAAAYAALPPLHCPPQCIAVGAAPPSVPPAPPAPPPAPPAALNPDYGHAQEVEHNDWDIPDQHPVSKVYFFININY